MEQNRIVKTAGQVMDEINQMNDGDIMEVYKVRDGFKTKFQSGWVPAPTDDLCHKCGGVMKFTGISRLSLPAQNEYRCEKCKHVQYRIEKNNMKKYRLKQWYPSLLKDVRVGDIITENGQHYKGVTYKGISYRVEIWQLHPDFWELIEEKKPLFVTEDGVEVFSDIDNLFAINLTYFSKTQNTLRSSRWLIDNPSYKVFSIESNADEYIWRNKPVFSYEEIAKRASQTELYYLKTLAKERI